MGEIENEELFRAGRLRTLEAANQLLKTSMQRGRDFVAGHANGLLVAGIAATNMLSENKSFAAGMPPQFTADLAVEVEEYIVRRFAEMAKSRN